jgi:hypothetical protein
MGLVTFPEMHAWSTGIWCGALLDCDLMNL